MPRMLVIESCIINYRDDRGGVHAESGEFVTVAKDTANDLARMGRVLYVERTDDPSKTGQHTASKEMLKAATDMAKAREAKAAQP